MSRERVEYTMGHEQNNNEQGGELSLRVYLCACKYGTCSAPLILHLVTVLYVYGGGGEEKSNEEDPLMEYIIVRIFQAAWALCVCWEGNRNSVLEAERRKEVYYGTERCMHCKTSWVATSNSAQHNSHPRLDTQIILIFNRKCLISIRNISILKQVEYTIS